MHFKQLRNLSQDTNRRLRRFRGRQRGSESGITVFENTDWNEQRVAATARQGIKAMRACYEEFMKANWRSLSHLASVIDFFRLHSGTSSWHQYSWPHWMMDDTDDPSTLDDAVSSP